MQWRAMRSEDIPAVKAMADEVHIAYPEDEAIFAERLSLFSEGCFLLEDVEGRPQGYLINHPWILGHIPPLNSLLMAIPEPASTHYIHDLALLEAARGCHHGARIVEDVAQLAADRGFSSVSLVAVNGSGAFWQRRSFRIYQDISLNDKLVSYGDGARYMIRDL
ncbi:GNAT family N-acetyltransferase [Consotaella salsifontis]|uniref:Acetyltransferase (GNAT) family protein n=1 Tax=Consotaella salsifontis TaxID=1365950 RepID=A0A1T4PV50_9HYPH|nr:GNAT family N-acetyltransferase [Consotaella salsifontis]SJZ95236.1 Acetyltransferase (GNAT) family protein [Consotaella salsifontis]